MLTESVMRRLRRGDSVVQFTGNYRRSIWSPHRGLIPGSQFLFGPARATYWIEQGEVHLLYEARDKPAVHYSGPVPRKQMAPALVFLLVMWPFAVMAATLIVLLGAHLASGLRPYGLALAAPPVLALIILPTGRALRWRHQRPSAVIAPEAAPGPVGRVVSPEVSLPPEVYFATATPRRSPGDTMRLARTTAGFVSLFAVMLLLVASLVLDPIAEYDDDIWAMSAVILGGGGIVLLFFSGIALVALSVAIARDKSRRGQTRTSPPS